MEHLFSGLDAVLFDLDGTLVETDIDFPLMKREMIRFAADHGLSSEELAGLDILAITDSLASHVRGTRGEAAAKAAYREALAILEDIELRHSASAREIRPARELTRMLRCLNTKVGVVTRNCRAASEQSLGRVGIAPDVLICREDVLRTKPSGDHLLAALEQLSARPEKSLMIGDHVMDILAGKAAGMRTIGLLTEGRTPEHFASARPDAMARNLHEILDALVGCHSQLEHEPAP